MAALFKYALKEPPSAEALETLRKTVPGVFAKGRLLLSPLNCAWHLEETLRAWGVPFKFIAPKPVAQMRWAEIVDATRHELLEWVPGFLANYQKLAIVFAQRAPDESAHLHHPTGCLTGDTTLIVNRGGNARPFKLRSIVARLCGEETSVRGRSAGRYAWDLQIPTRTQSVDLEGNVRLNEIDRVFSNGVKPVYELVTVGGRSIRATAEHRFMRPDHTFTTLGDLRAGDEILAVVWPKWSGVKHKPAYRVVRHLWNHPYAVITYTGRNERIATVPYHRLVAEAHENKISVEELVGRLVLNEVEGLVFLDPNERHVHHKNRDPLDNRLDNLEVLSVEEHLRRHGQEDGWKHVSGRTEPDRVRAITAAGVEEVFDLGMATPMHNYVANELVTHNSGKSVTGITWGLIRPLPIVFVTKAAARETIRREFERYTTVRPLVMTPKSERKAKAPDPVVELERALEAGASPRALIVAWESLTEYTDLLVRCAPYSLVLDEIHMAKEHRRWIKLPNGGDDPDALEFARRDNRAAHIQRLAGNARRRLGMTATPIPDRRRDLWAQFDLVHPYSFGKFWEFCARYTDLTTTNHGNKDNTGESNTEELDRRMTFVCHKVDYSVTHRELPPKRRQVLYIPKAQQGRPDAFADELRRAMKLGHKRALEVMFAESASRKRPVLLDQVADAARSGGKVVVLTGRHKDCERWELALEKRLPKIQRWMGHGGHGTAYRDEIREAYMAHPGPCVLVGTGDAWGESVSLHDTDLAVNAMLPITPKQLWQREGRFHRQGGKRSVLILYPVAEGTIDEHQHQILLSKLPSVADLQKDSDFIAAMNDLQSSGLSEKEIVDSLFAKITAGADAPSEEGESHAGDAEPGADAEPDAVRLAPELDQSGEPEPVAEPVFLE